MLRGRDDYEQYDIEFHKYRIIESFGLKNSAELIQFAIKHGIV